MTQQPSFGLSQFLRGPLFPSEDSMQLGVCFFLMVRPPTGQWVLALAFESLNNLKMCISTLWILWRHANQLLALDHHQGGRTWQPFVGSKNGNDNFRQARIYNFRVKCAGFARNCKFAKLTKCNIYHVIVHFLPKKHCFWPIKKALVLPKDLQKVRKSRQILQNSVCSALKFSSKSKLFGGCHPCSLATSATLCDTIKTRFTFNRSGVKTISQ